MHIMVVVHIGPRKKKKNKKLSITNLEYESEFALANLLHDIYGAPLKFTREDLRIHRSFLVVTLHFPYHSKLLPEVMGLRNDANVFEHARGGAGYTI